MEFKWRRAERDCINSKFQMRGSSMWVGAGRRSSSKWRGTWSCGPASTRGRHGWGPRKQFHRKKSSWFTALTLSIPVFVRARRTPYRCTGGPRLLLVSRHRQVGCSWRRRHCERRWYEDVGHKIAVMRMSFTYTSPNWAGQTLLSYSQ
jgi:hypothetical protein